jgi:hypothetical protein
MRTEKGFYLYTSIKELENDKNKFTKFNKPDYDGFVSVDFDSLYEHKIAGRSDFKPLKEIESKVDVVQYRSDFYENTELCFTDVSQVMKDIPDELKNEKVNFYIKSLSHFKSGSGPGEIYNFDRYLNVVLYLDENSLNNFLNILTSNYYKYFTVFFGFSKFHDCTEGNYRITSYDLNFKKGKR